MESVSVNVSVNKTGKSSSYFRIMNRELKLWQSLLFTFVIMSALLFYVYRFNVPNPNMILIAGLVICSAVFGYEGGILAAVIMLFYTLYFFSDKGSFTQFSPENQRKVMVSLFGIFVDMLFVCELKRREKAAFAEIKDLSDKLREENELLQESSLTDTLTGIGNRLALRKDFDSYRGMDLHVVMLDVDNFKSINDRYGHMQGDNILAETGRLISDTFGREHCYRYGGDEFLMIIPGIGDDEFIEKLHHIMNSRPVIEEDEAKARAGYSIGYISGKAEHNYTLRGMLDRSDELMYEAKTSGKNKIVGDN